MVGALVESPALGAHSVTATMPSERIVGGQPLLGAIGNPRGQKFGKVHS